MEEVIDLWTTLRQRIDVLIEQLRGIPVGQKLAAFVEWLRQIPLDLALTIAAIACLVAVLLLISRLRARRAYRRMQAERDDLKEQLAALQTKYDGEVHWRTAAERFHAPKAQNEAAASPAANR